MPFRRLLGMGAALLGGIVGGCDDGPATAPSGLRSPAAWSSMVHAGKAGPILVEVRGTPFRTSAEAFVKQVAAAMEGAVAQRVFRFTADPAAAKEPHLRTVVLFAPERIVDETAACAGLMPPPFAEGELAETIHLLAAFCSKDRPLAAATGWVRKVGDAGDPRFVALVQQTTRELFREDALGVQ